MTNNPHAATNDSRPTTNGHSLNSNGPANGVAPPPPSRILVVEIRASGNWKDACRQSVRLAERYVGNAGLRLQLAGQGLVMDFPDRRIECASIWSKGWSGCRGSAASSNCRAGCLPAPFSRRTLAKRGG